MPPILQFLFDIGGEWGKVFGVCALILVSAVGIAIVLIAPAVAFAYLWQHHAPLAAKVGIGSGSTVVTMLLTLLFGHWRRTRGGRRANRLSARPPNGGHADPGGNAPGA